VTQLGDITLDIPINYNYGQYSVSMSGFFNDVEDLHCLRELFALTRVGTAIHEIPGRRPVGEDLDEELRNTQWVQFTDGDLPLDRPISGWYLLRGISFYQSTTPRGVIYNFSITLFFLGTDAMYQPGFIVKGQEDVENDWGI